MTRHGEWLAAKGPYVLITLMLLAGLLHFYRNEQDIRQRIIDMAGANALFAARILADRTGLNLETADIALLDAARQSENGVCLGKVAESVHQAAQASSAVRCILAAPVGVEREPALSGGCPDARLADLAALVARHERRNQPFLVSPLPGGLAPGALVSRLVAAPSGKRLVAAQVDFLPHGDLMFGGRLEYPGQIVLFDENAAPFFLLETNRPGPPQYPSSLDELPLFAGLSSSQLLSETFSLLATKAAIVAVSKAPGASLRVGVALDLSQVLAQWQAEMARRLAIRLVVYAVIVLLAVAAARRGRALLLSKSGYERLFAAVPEPLYLFDTSLRFLGANEAGLRWIGLSRGELLKADLRNFVQLTDEDFSVKVDRLWREGRDRYKTRIRLPTGEVRPVEITAAASTGAEGPVGLALVRDVSEQTRLDTDLARANDTLRAVLSTLPGHIEVVDTSFRVIEQSSSLAGLLPGDETPGEARFCRRRKLGATDCCPECVVRVAMAEKRQVTRVTQPGERQVLGFDAKFHAAPLINEQGEVWGAVEFIMDITDLVDSRRALAASEARLSMVVEAARFGVWDLDFQTMDNKVNDNWYTMLGYEPGAFPVTHQAWLELVHADDRDTVLARFREHMALKTPFCQLEYRLRGADGGYRWILDVCHVYQRKADGAPARAAGIHLDIDARKRLEDQLTAAKEEAESASRAKSRFLANVSHELRTPLSAVLGYARLAASEDLAEPVRGHVRRIHLAAEMLARLVGDILDLSKIEADQMDFPIEAFRPTELLRRVHDLFAQTARNKGLDLRLGIDPAVPERLLGSAQRLEQVLINLVGNAIKYTGPGQVNILLDSLACPKPGQARVRFLVADTGLGFDPGAVSGFFEPFRQAAGTLKWTNTGTGLGLSISARLAELMGSRLFACGEPGQGAQFCFTLDLRREVDEKACALSSGPDGLPELAGLTVLVVEDNAINREMLLALLGRAGCRAFGAENGLAGLAAARERLPDVILMDINMPVMDGLEAASRLKADPATSGIALIALTANADLGSGDGPGLPGFAATIGKPFDLDDLCRAIASARSTDGSEALAAQAGG